MKISTDEIIYFQRGFLRINATILYTWVIIIAVLVFGLFLKRYLRKKKNGKIQLFFELFFEIVEKQIRQMGNFDMKLVLPFIICLFSFILLSNFLDLLIFTHAPTASLSTTAALAIISFSFSVFYGIKKKGIKFFKKFLEPVAVLLPLNILSEIISNCSLALRLYGNLMSSMIVGAVITEISFLILGFPVFLSLLSFITSIMQAFIFSVLTLVAISSVEE
ncbi:MAG: F0F1 ATP synthase subunit A [Rickettsiales bacterium]|jgi:F-type H+-transporting ATPase subunit a|nr:F0F1 ATP synthase subunit A [Rickettsiales bacterium]